MLFGQTNFSHRAGRAQNEGDHVLFAEVHPGGTGTGTIALIRPDPPRFFIAPAMLSSRKPQHQQLKA
jgi:hypothetical protein